MSIRLFAAGARVSRGLNTVSGIFYMVTLKNAVLQKCPNSLAALK